MKLFDKPCFMYVMFTVKASERDCSTQFPLVTEIFQLAKYIYFDVLVRYSSIHSGKQKRWPTDIKKRKLILYIKKLGSNPDSSIPKLCMEKLLDEKIRNHFSNLQVTQHEP